MNLLSIINNFYIIYFFQYFIFLYIIISRIYSIFIILCGIQKIKIGDNIILFSKFNYKMELIKNNNDVFYYYYYYLFINIIYIIISIKIISILSNYEKFNNKKLFIKKLFTF